MDSKASAWLYSSDDMWSCNLLRFDLRPTTIASNTSVRGLRDILLDCVLFGERHNGVPQVFAVHITETTNFDGLDLEHSITNAGLRNQLHYTLLTSRCVFSEVDVLCKPLSKYVDSLDYRRKPLTKVLCNSRSVFNGEFRNLKIK